MKSYLCGVTNWITEMFEHKKKTDLSITGKSGQISFSLFSLFHQLALTRGFLHTFILFPPPPKKKLHISVADKKKSDLHSILTEYLAAGYITAFWLRGVLARRNTWWGLLIDSKWRSSQSAIYFYFIALMWSSCFKYCYLSALCAVFTVDTIMFITTKSGCVVRERAKEREGGINREREEVRAYNCGNNTSRTVVSWTASLKPLSLHLVCLLLCACYSVWVMALCWFPGNTLTDDLLIICVAQSTNISVVLWS